jgi:hypothetical protein
MPFKDIFNREKGDKFDRVDKVKKKQENAGDQGWLREQQSGGQRSVGTFEFLRQQELEGVRNKIKELGRQYKGMSKSEKKGKEGTKVQSEIARYNERKETIKLRLSEMRQPATVQEDTGYANYPQPAEDTQLTTTGGHFESPGQGGAFVPDNTGASGWRDTSALRGDNQPTTTAQGDTGYAYYPQSTDNTQLTTTAWGGTTDAHYPPHGSGSDMLVSPVSARDQPGGSNAGYWGDANALYSSSQGLDAQMQVSPVSTRNPTIRGRESLVSNYQPERSFQGGQNFAPVEESSYVGETGGLQRTDTISRSHQYDVGFYGRGFAPVEESSYEETTHKEPVAETQDTPQRSSFVEAALQAEQQWLNLQSEQWPAMQDRRRRLPDQND